MANNYTQFSFLIGDITPEEKVWCETQVDENIEVDDDDDRWGFSIEIDGTDLVIFAEENGNVEHTATFVQAFLKKFRPKEVVCFSWAETCSKMRPGETTMDATKVWR